MPHLFLLQQFQNTSKHCLCNPGRTEYLKDGSFLSMTTRMITQLFPSKRKHDRFCSLSLFWAKEAIKRSSVRNTPEQAVNRPSGGWAGHPMSEKTTRWLIRLPGGWADYPIGLLALSTAWTPREVQNPTYSAGQVSMPSGQRNHFRGKKKKAFIFGMYQTRHLFPTQTDSSLKRLLSLYAQLGSRGDPVSLLTSQLFTWSLSTPKWNRIFQLLGKK